MVKVEGFELYQKLRNFMKNEDVLNKLITALFIIFSIIYQIFLGTERLIITAVVGLVVVIIMGLSYRKEVKIEEQRNDYFKFNYQLQAITQKMSFNNSIAQTVILQVSNYIKTSEGVDKMALSHFSNILESISDESPDFIKLLNLNFNDFVQSWDSKDKITEDISSFAKTKIDELLTNETESELTSDIDDQKEKIDDFNKPTDEVTPDSVINDKEDPQMGELIP